MKDFFFTDMQNAIFNYIKSKNSQPEPQLLVYENGKYICGDLIVEIFRINIELRWKATLGNLILADEELTTEQRFDLKQEFDNILEEQNQAQREKFIEEYENS